MGGKPNPRIAFRRPLWRSRETLSQGLCQGRSQGFGPSSKLFVYNILRAIFFSKKPCVTTCFFVRTNRSYGDWDRSGHKIWTHGFSKRRRLRSTAETASIPARKKFRSPPRFPAPPTGMADSHHRSAPLPENCSGCRRGRSTAALSTNATAPFTQSKPLPPADQVMRCRSGRMSSFGNIGSRVEPSAARCPRQRVHGPNPQMNSPVSGNSTGRTGTPRKRS